MRTLLLAAALALPALAQDTPVARLVDQLGSDEIDVRERAESELVKLGRPALAELRKSLAAAKDEPKARLERVVRAITQPRWMTDTAAALAEAKRLDKPLLVFSTIGDLGGYA